MPILVQEIFNRGKASLDDEGSDRYLFDQDFKPNINSAIEILITMLNQAFDSNKLSPECLRELINVWVWQTNAYSRVSYSAADTGHEKWTIFGIYPKIKANKMVSGAPQPDPSTSKFRGDISFISSKKSAKRLTFEEWNQNVDNIFMPGNALLNNAGGLVEYAYLDEANYTSTSYAGNPGQVEFTIRPDIPNELVAIAYLKYPTPVALITDSVQFPSSLTDLITEITLIKIAEKQSDQSTLWQTSGALMNRLIGLLK